MLVSSCALNQGHSNQDVMCNSFAQFTSLHKLQDKNSHQSGNFPTVVAHQAPVLVWAMLVDAFPLQVC
jgi:hypothetical protein